MTKVRKGDAVKLGGRLYVIDEVFYADHYGNPRRPSRDDGWMIEFRDSDGQYHYWKQYEDGGEFIPAC